MTKKLSRIVALMLAVIVSNGERVFADVNSISHYARTPVDFCVNAGLITGFEDGTFRPKESSTRAQLAAILMKLGMLINGEEVPIDPIPSRSASKYCSTILPLNSFGFLIWKSISEDDSIEKILDMCRIFSRRTDEENTNRIEAFTKALYEKGFIVLKDTEEG